MNSSLRCRSLRCCHCLLAVLVFCGIGTAQVQAQSGRVQGFGVPAGQPSLPGFGALEEGLPQVGPQDEGQATAYLGQVDTDKDGHASREELRRAGHAAASSWFRFDLDGNQKLSSTELAYAFADSRIRNERKARAAARAKQRAAAQNVTDVDKNAAATQIQQLDKNRDRKLSPSEMAAVWPNTKQLFAEFDSNRSGYLGRTELSRHLAKQRAMQQAHLHRNFQIQGFGSGRVILFNNNQQNTVVQELLRKFDTNGNGSLEAEERAELEGQFAGCDVDRDGVFTVTELTNWIQARHRTGASSGPGSGWFAERDKDRDGVVTMSEYAKEWTEELVADFNGYDRNRDGLIDRKESRIRPAPAGRIYSSRRAAVIEAGVGAASTIHVPDDFLISDLNLRLDITHQVPGQLDIELLTPYGESLVLVRGEGKAWKGSHFDQTVLDDQAEASLADSKPPFQVRLRPEKAAADHPVLDRCIGRRSAGNWRLVVNGQRAVRSGLLNGWELIFVSQDKPSENSR